MGFTLPPHLHVTGSDRQHARAYSERYLVDVYEGDEEGRNYMKIHQIEIITNETQKLVKVVQRVLIGQTIYLDMPLLRPPRPPLLF